MSLPSLQSTGSRTDPSDGMHEIPTGAHVDSVFRCGLRARRAHRICISLEIKVRLPHCVQLQPQLLDLDPLLCLQPWRASLSSCAHFTAERAHALPVERCEHAAQNSVVDIAAPEGLARFRQFSRRAQHLQRLSVRSALHIGGTTKIRTCDEHLGPKLDCCVDLCGDFLVVVLASAVFQLRKKLEQCAAIRDHFCPHPL
jgi:hypothetical protein